MAQMVLAGDMVGITSVRVEVLGERDLERGRSEHSTALRTAFGEHSGGFPGQQRIGDASGNVPAGSRAAAHWGCVGERSGGFPGSSALGMRRGTFRRVPGAAAHWGCVGERSSCLNCISAIQIRSEVSAPARLLPRWLGGGYLVSSLLVLGSGGRRGCGRRHFFRRRSWVTAGSARTRLGN